MAFHRKKGDRPLVVLESGTWFWHPPLELVLFVEKGKQTASESIWLIRKGQNSQMGALRAIMRLMEQRIKEAR